LVVGVGYVWVAQHGLALLLVSKTPSRLGFHLTGGVWRSNVLARPPRVTVSESRLSPQLLLSLEKCARSNDCLIAIMATNHRLQLHCTKDSGDMHMHSNMFVSNTYNRLLADICYKYRVSLDTPDLISYDWAYIDGPKLDKEVLAYLEGRVTQVTFPEWIKPLWDMFIRNDDPILLGDIRQLLVFCYKTEHEPTKLQLESAQADFEETEAGVAIWDSYFSNSSHLNHTIASARRIIGSIIYRIDWSEITPSHGPGAVFPPRAPSEKSCFRTLYSSIIAKYPYDQYYCGIPSYWVPTMVSEEYGPLDEKDDIVAKLTAVPKDSRGPRLICVHPAESIWIQQGQRRLLEARITNHPLTKGRINFTDQTVNGKLALSSSLSREFVTLDLKEASDRISCRLVKSLFGDYTYDWISCSRANKVKLLDGREIELKKWAPMGNALCFPVESLIFFSLVHAAIRSHYGIDCREVYVFGDDIIFPKPYKEGVITTLVMFGLIPNISKTFSSGFFRESCGVEAYKGVDITPLRLKKDNVGPLSSVVSICDLALRARLKGYDRCAAFLYSEARRSLGNRGINLPITNERNNGGFFEYQDIPFTEILLRDQSVKYNTRWQRWGARNWTVTGKQLAIRTGGWYHLQDSLLRIGLTNSGNPIGSDSPSDRGTEYAVPRRTQLSRGWLNYSLE
jgi:hypothetical protein